jgi:hypothetical protein
MAVIQIDESKCGGPSKYERSYREQDYVRQKFRFT